MTPTSMHTTEFKFHKEELSIANQVKLFVIANGQVAKLQVFAIAKYFTLEEYATPNTVEKSRYNGWYAVLTGLLVILSHS